MGKAMVVVDVEARSCVACELLLQGGAAQTTTTHLLEKIRRQHEDVSIRPERLHGAEVADALLLVFRRRHDLEDVERGPRHVVAHHLEVYEFEQRGGLQVCTAASARVPVLSRSRPEEATRTHVLAPNLLATFFQAVLYVLALVALVISQASDEVVEGFLEPGDLSVHLESSTAQRRQRVDRERYILGDDEGMPEPSRGSVRVS